MNSAGNLGRQFSDLVVYLLLPLLCLLLPVRWGNRLLQRCARRGWVLKARSRGACSQAAAMMFLPDEAAWQIRWRLVELAEARDAWFCLVGRSGSLLEQINWLGKVPERGIGQALIGLHWGPGVLALKAFQERGLAPRFVYRPVDGSLRSKAPFQHLYLRVLVRVINSCCDQSAITVPGAKAKLLVALQQPCTPVLLMDAPPVAERRVVNVRLLERSACLAADGMTLLAEAQARCTFFALGLDENGTGRNLSFVDGGEMQDMRALADRFGVHFDQFVLGDSAQWRLWHAAGQLFEFEQDA